jgi:hypothetical protein
MSPVLHHEAFFNVLDSGPLPEIVGIQTWEMEGSSSITVFRV